MPGDYLRNGSVDWLFKYFSQKVASDSLGFIFSNKRVSCWSGMITIEIILLALKPSLSCFPLNLSKQSHSYVQHTELDLDRWVHVDKH